MSLRKIKIIVTSCVSAFVCAVVVLAVLIVVRVNQNATETRLQNTYNSLQTQLSETQGQIDYYLSSKFIEEYALYVLGYGKDGAKLFQN